MGDRDIVERLGAPAEECTYDELDMDRSDAKAEIARLRRWKVEATAVIEQWEAAWERVGKPAGLGRLKWDGMTDEIERLRAAGDRLAELSGTVRDGWDQELYDALAAWREARRD